MDSTQISGLILAGFLLAFAVWQFREQRRDIPKLNAVREQFDPDTFRFLLHQARRRMQTGVLFGIAALAMIGGFYLPPTQWPNLFVLTWLAAILFLLWGIGLTFIDLLAMKIRFSNEKRRQEAIQNGLDYLLKTANTKDNVDGQEPKKNPPNNPED